MAWSASRRCRAAIPTTTTRLRKFAGAVLAAEPNAIGGPVSILKSGDTVVKAFIHAGIWALVVISLFCSGWRCGGSPTCC